METNLDKTFKTNAAMENEGIELTFDDVVFFKVKRFHSGNPRAKAAMATHFKPYARQMELGTLPLEKVREINIKLFVDVSLVSWRGLEDKKKNAIPYSRETAIELMHHLPEVFDFLWKHANDFTNYKEDVGNS